MRLVRNFLCSLFAVAMVMMAVPSANVSAAADCSNHFLGLRAWYDGLTKAGSCDVMTPQDENEAKSFVWTIILNVASMILGITGYAAIGFVIWGGIQYMTAQGDPGKVAKGKKTITNAVIGIIIVSSASMISGMISDIITDAPRNDGGSFVRSILNHVFLWSGIIAVIMVVYGGIQYVTSTGNAPAVAKAKNTIMYSLIGIVIVALAAAIVSSVLNTL